jgi:SAM-dependent methyltransferase
LDYNARKLSEIDLANYQIIRNSVYEFQNISLKSLIRPSRILDIAPQVHVGIFDIASKIHNVETLDISNEYSPTYVADICAPTGIPSNSYDVVFFTEVIEHVSNPFAAVDEIHRLLKVGGLLFATSPLNFRIHGPMPDNWRITEHGWRHLLRNFNSVNIDIIEDSERFLFPIHYRISAKK